jgi:uncharacterized RDD family membrane protein YckC
MEQIVDTINEIPQEPEYASFGTRLGASLLDVLILSPLNVGLTYWCLLYVKSYLLSLVPSLIGIAYKCYMEKKYGATFGKKIIGIKIVTENLQALTDKAVLIRNYNYFASFLLVLFTHYMLYSMPGFESVSTYMEAMQMQNNMPIIPKITGYMIGLLFLVDCLLMINHTKNQTLHDRWAKTVAIKKDSI